jgi:hypothetical protein
LIADRRGKSTRATGAPPRGSRVTRADPRQRAAAPIAIAATPVPPAASGVADDLRFIQGTNRSPAAPGRADFYSRPGHELGRDFSRVREK